jgi:hypothetical protein
MATWQTPADHQLKNLKLSTTRRNRQWWRSWQRFRRNDSTRQRHKAKEAGWEDEEAWKATEEAVVIKPENPFHVRYRQQLIKLPNHKQY